MGNQQTELDNFSRMVEKDFLPLYEGHSTAQKHISAFMSQIGKMNKDDDNLTKVLPLALGKPLNKRGAFDQLALTYAYNTTQVYQQNVTDQLAQFEEDLADCVSICEVGMEKRTQAAED